MTDQPDRLVILENLYAMRRYHRKPADLSRVGLSLEDGLKIQLAVLRRFEESGELLGGWKVGLTSGSNRDRMGKDFRPFGYVLKSRVVRSGVEISRANILNCQIEPEICLVMGKPLHGGTVSIAEAKAAVRGVAPAFEINEIRVPRDWNEGLRLGDGLSQWGIVLGPESAVRDELNQTTLELFREGERILTSTPGATMDDPYLSLARLCQLLHKHGLGLQAGQPVITGAFCHEPVARPGRYRALFTNVGEVSVEFTD